MADETPALTIDGETYTFDDLTFREQRELRARVVELTPDGDPENAAMMDLLPAFLWVVKRRDDPEFSIEQALDIKQSDLEAPAARPARKARS